MVRSVRSDSDKVCLYKFHRRFARIDHSVIVSSKCVDALPQIPSRIRLERFNRANLPPLFPRYNIAPSQSVLGIVSHGGELEGRLMKWGLVPSRSTDAKGFINARAETITEKLSFSESFQRRRCLIPADGFYEWQRTGNCAAVLFPVEMSRPSRLRAFGTSGKVMKQSYPARLLPPVRMSYWPRFAIRCL